MGGAPRHKGTKAVHAPATGPVARPTRCPAPAAALKVTGERVRCRAEIGPAGQDAQRLQPARAALGGPYSLPHPPRGARLRVGGPPNG